MPVVVIHGGAGSRSADLKTCRKDYLQALSVALERAATLLEQGGAAIDAVQAAVMVMEDECDLLNAGRGSVLCRDGTIEMSAAVMRGDDRGAGAVAAVTRSRHPVLAARAVLDHTPHVLMVGARADAVAAAAGVAQREPEYFITARRRARLDDLPSDFAGGTVGAVCRDATGSLAAATSTGGRQGQLPGRIGDSPLPGAGTWADEHVAISCTGDGEEFIRSGVARHISALVAAGTPIAAAADAALAQVGELGGTGGVIAVDAGGQVALRFTTEAMPRGMRRGANISTWLL
jgi:beta-aspartyl-peptidase (threonine type)